MSGSASPIRVMAVLEGLSVTGPAKNLFAFAKLARDAHPRGVDLSLVTYQRGNASSGLIQGARAAGIDVHVVRESRAFQPSILRELARLTAELRPDILQTHNLKSHFLVRLLGLWRAYPWIAFHHGYVSTAKRVHLYNQLDRWSLRKADRVVTVCEPFARHLQKIGVPPDRIIVRHNMVQPLRQPPPSELGQLRRTLRIGPESLMVLSAGRLSKEKGHLDLIEAIGLLRDDRDVPPFQLLIAGEGPEREKIEGRIRELGIADRVHLIGHQPSLDAYYAVADLMVLPSHSEGSPNVLLEAMAAGVPSIATRVGGVPEIAENERNAIVVPRRDVPEMARAIARLLTDVGLRHRLASAGVAISEPFASAAYCEAILELYREVLASRGRT